MGDVIVVILLVAVLGLALFYILRSKRKGNKCIGCPYGKTCQNKGACPSGEPLEK